MPLDANAVVGLVNIASPMIFAIIAAIRAHHNATGQFPTNEQILAAVPFEADEIHQMWASWSALHPTTVVPPVVAP
jgi:hypothetical protein